MKLPTTQAVLSRLRAAASRESTIACASTCTNWMPIELLICPVAGPDGCDARHQRLHCPGCPVVLYAGALVK